MVSLSAPPANWSEAIRDAAIHFMNAEVCFYETVEVVPPNVVTGDPGVTGIDILWQGKARVQHIRSPREFATDYQANSTRFFRYQLDPQDNPPQLGFGVKSRVLDGGRDPGLENLVFTVNSAINSSHMAVRTVELASNMDFIEWSWSPTVPAKPYGLTESLVTDSGFRVDWQAPPGDPAPTEYQVEIDGDIWLDYESGTFAEFDDLEPDSNYTVRVRARAAGAWGDWSAPLAVKTEEE